MPIAAETIYDLIRELGTETCVAYTECFKKIGAAKLKRRGLDPKSLLILNLELRELELLPNGKFWLGGDGCGNYYFVKRGDRRGAVALWSHEGPTIAPMDVVLLEFLRVAKPESESETEPPPGHAYISRTKVSGESILDPIKMDQWRRFVHKHPALQYSGARFGTNPFTGKEMRFDCPGLAVGYVGDRQFGLQLEHGRVRADDVFAAAKPLVQEIAAALKCSVMFGAVRRGGGKGRQKKQAKSKS
jgi:hypothetical protein